MYLPIYIVRIDERMGAVFFLSGGRDSNLAVKTDSRRVMAKPNFKAMTRKELLAYMLEHQDDDDSFYAYMDKVNAKPPAKFYPAPSPLTT